MKKNKDYNLIILIITITAAVLECIGTIAEVILKSRGL